MLESCFWSSGFENSIRTQIQDALLCPGSRAPSSTRGSSCTWEWLLTTCTWISSILHLLSSQLPSSSSSPLTASGGATPGPCQTWWLGLPALPQPSSQRVNHLKEALGRASHPVLSASMLLWEGPFAAARAVLAAPVPSLTWVKQGPLKTSTDMGSQNNAVELIDTC